MIKEITVKECCIQTVEEKLEVIRQKINEIIREVNDRKLPDGLD